MSDIRIPTTLLRWLSALLDLHKIVNLPLASQSIPSGGRVQKLESKCHENPQNFPNESCRCAYAEFPQSSFGSFRSFLKISCLALSICLKVSSGIKPQTKQTPSR